MAGTPLEDGHLTMRSAAAGETAGCSGVEAEAPDAGGVVRPALEHDLESGAQGTALASARLPCEEGGPSRSWSRTLDR
ncbi:MAG TPA: hypothetical protein VKB31_07020 [Trueperaceae bacterium]|nr:hypothetical protein [Trueperaceae bacterium]